MSADEQYPAKDSLLFSSKFSFAHRTTLNKGAFCGLSHANCLRIKSSLADSINDVLLSHAQFSFFQAIDFFEEKPTVVDWLL